MNGDKLRRLAAAAAAAATTTMMHVCAHGVTRARAHKSPPTALLLLLAVCWLSQRRLAASQTAADAAAKTHAAAARTKEARCGTAAAAIGRIVRARRVSIGRARWLACVRAHTHTVRESTRASIEPSGGRSDVCQLARARAPATSTTTRSAHWRVSDAN